MTEPILLAAGFSAAAVLLAAPHLLPLDRVDPRWAARAWGAALGLRALLMVCLVAVSLFWLPATSTFANLAGTRFHAAEAVNVTFVHLDLSGDLLAHSTALAPLVFLAASTAVFLCALGWTWLLFERRLRRYGVGRDSRGSLLIADGNVYVGVPGLGRRRIVVSAGAIASLDDGELEASVAHERGHLVLGHRRWVLAGSALRALGRPLPGARACERGMRLSLEREADEYALGLTGAPMSLASAICKVARGFTPRSAIGLAAPDHLVRLDQLLEGGRVRSSRLVEAAAVALACALLVLAAVLAVAVAALLAGTATLGLALACSV